MLADIFLKVHLSYAWDGYALCLDPDEDHFMLASPIEN